MDDLTVVLRQETLAMTEGNNLALVFYPWEYLSQVTKKERGKKTQQL